MNECVDVNRREKKKGEFVTCQDVFGAGENSVSDTFINKVVTYYLYSQNITSFSSSSSSSSFLQYLFYIL